jgi:threonylcarbamoyladenosine tRNA methylthiotransferase MtaB
MHEISQQNIKEIVLTGVNIEIMKREFGNKNTNILFELVQELDKVEGIERLRISSIEPNLLKMKR